MYISAPLVTTHQRGTRAKNVPSPDTGNFFVQCNLAIFWRANTKHGVELLAKVM